MPVDKGGISHCPNLSNSSWLPSPSLRILFPASSCPAMHSHLHRSLLLPLQQQAAAAAGAPGGDPLLLHVQLGAIKYLYLISIFVGSKTEADDHKGKASGDVERRMRRGSSHSPKEEKEPSKQTSSPGEVSRHLQ